MIETAAILWACAATGLGIAAAIGWLCTINQRNELDQDGYQWWCRAIDAEVRLRRIERQRHESAKRARAIQLERQRAKQSETTARLKAGR